MSLEPLLWAMHDSPVADTTERSILMAMAEKAHSDGTDSFPSRPTMARVALCDVKTVQRKIRVLLKRGLIAYGDQDAARYIPRHVRPRVYDLMIPASWYGAERLERVNQDRAHRGLPPLTSEERPPLAPAPSRNERSDKGKPRKKPAAPAGETTSGEGGLTVPPSVIHRGDSQSRGRGDSQSPGGGLTVPQPSPVTPPTTETRFPPVRPSPPAGSSAGARTDTDGRTDGGNVTEGQEAAPPSAASGGDSVARTPGVELLLAIGADDPRYLLTGPTLRDQGMTVSGMLAEGWSPDLIRHVITSRPLPDPIRKTIGAIVSGRLRNAAAAGAPGSAAVPQQFAHGDGQQPAPEEFDARPKRAAMPECAACGRVDVVPGNDLCPRCLGWPTCTRCSGPTPRYVSPTGSGVCGVCAADARQPAALPPTDAEWAELTAAAARAAAEGGS